MRCYELQKKNGPEIRTIFHTTMKMALFATTIVSATTGFGTFRFATAISAARTNRFFAIGTTGINKYLPFIRFELI